jgi:hypothetical protein
MATKKGHEIPTIDVALVTIKPEGSETEIILDTANQISISVQSETEDAIKLVVKGRLISQKPSTTTVTGNTITLTDNVFNPELVTILQGGTVKYWTDEGMTTEGDEDKGFGVASYAPPVAGSDDKGTPCELKAYSSIYDAAGIITGYECITYPNCQGVPVGFSSEDGAFRAPEYTINSAPKTGEPPYKISYIGAGKLPKASS